MNNKSQQYQLDSLTRVEDFLNTHPEVGAVKGSEGAQELAAAIAQIRTQVNDQGTTALQLAGQRGSAQSLIVQLKEQYMQPIAKFARAKLKGVPDFAALTVSVHNQRPMQLVGAARAMATAAAPQVQTLASGGFAGDVVTKLGAAADAVEAALTARANTKVARVAAGKGIAEQLLRGRAAVKMLDAVLSPQFAGNATLLGAWRTAKRVTRLPSASQPATVAPTPPTPAAATAASPVTASPEPSSAVTAVKS